MSSKMIVTHRRQTKRERQRREFRHWWYQIASDFAKLEHIMGCAEGCVGCLSIPGLFSPEHARRKR